MFENCCKSKEQQPLQSCLRIPILIFHFLALVFHCCPAWLQQLCLRLSGQSWMCSCCSLAALGFLLCHPHQIWAALGRAGFLLCHPDQSVWMSSVAVFLLWCSCLPCDSCGTPASEAGTCSQTICTFLQLFVPKTRTLHKQIPSCVYQIMSPAGWAGVQFWFYSPDLVIQFWSNTPHTCSSSQLGTISNCNI